MLNLPAWMITIVGEFAPAIYGLSTWYKVEVLVAGVILARGQRTVSAVLRVMGLSQDRNYALYHQVLSRAVWSGLAASAILLRLLLKTFDEAGPIVVGIDDTIERRRGDKIAAMSPRRRRSQRQTCGSAIRRNWVVTSAADSASRLDRASRRLEYRQPASTHSLAASRLR